MRKLAVFLAVLIQFGCSKHSDPVEDMPPVSKYPGYKEYFIPKGANYSQQNEYHSFRAPELNFSAIFDSSAIYQTKDPGNQADINKLYGVSDGNTHHQDNSARFGWNWNGHAIQIHAYCYAGSVREFKWIGNVQPGEPHSYSIRIDNSHYIFQFDNKVEYMHREIRDSVLNGYSLYPYFGGDETAPHDIRIYLKETPQ
ncbi:MAG TPA: hypothetical protein VLC28_14085 [Flavitalea sp.]|nr:hypothetical protein [Flavitalea sp.]